MYGKCVALQLPYSAVKMDVYIGEGKGGQSHASGLVLERGGLKGERDAKKEKKNDASFGLIQTQNKGARWVGDNDKKIYN